MTQFKKLKIIIVKERLEDDIKDIIKIISENFLRLWKELNILVSMIYRNPDSHDQIITSLWHTIIKIEGNENMETIKAVRGKQQVTYREKSVRITDFSNQNLNAKI